MQTGKKAFSARVALPYRLSDHAGHRITGTAISIDTRSAVLVIAAGLIEHPRPGEVVDLELDLPVNEVSAPARCLAVRATVAEVTDLRGGARHMTVRFRKPAFKEPERVPKKQPMSAVNGWEM